MSIYFQDRMGNKKTLISYNGETIDSVLGRYHIPTTSVITTVNDIPVSEMIEVDSNFDYYVKLIEGYDIESIISSVFPDMQVDMPYIKHQVFFDVDGTLVDQHVPMNCADVVEMVEENIKFAILNYHMINEGDTVLVGLSGGVDSSSLLIALAKISKELNFNIIAATFEDFDSVSSPAFKNAQQLAKNLGVEHKLIPSRIIEDSFHLNKSLRTILPEMMDTQYRSFAMYADHHTTRRALEIFADEIGVDKILLGLHTTDLIAGLINSYTTGYQMANMFRRQIGRYTYIYPLMFIPKKELHLYFYAHQQRYAVHTYPNAWELNPKDRNYYYYLADQLQVVFPGIENYLFEAHSVQLQNQTPLKFTQCKNCGAHILQQHNSNIEDDKCDVCRVFQELGFIDQ